MATTDFDVVIIGAGISGISAAYHLQKHSPNRTYTILEGRQNMGGTWDLFQFPGIRSDSDMYTLGFSFRPYEGEKAIADGASILNYLKDTAAEYGMDKRIQFNHRVVAANWSSEEARWKVQVKEMKSGNIKAYTCNFLFACTGYYNYEEGYLPVFKGRDHFKGDIVHPQHWPEGLDYEDKTNSCHWQWCYRNHINSSAG